MRIFPLVLLSGCGPTLVGYQSTRMELEGPSPDGATWTWILIR
jgi:hypothetical protein